MPKDPKYRQEIEVCVTGDLVVVEPPKGLGNEGEQNTKRVLAGAY